MLSLNSHPINHPYKLSVRPPPTGNTIIFWVMQKGKCAVLLNNKIGFVDVEGKEVIAPQFDDADDFINGKAQVKKGNDVYYIDKTGKKPQ